MSVNCVIECLRANVMCQKDMSVQTASKTLRIALVEAMLMFGTRTCLLQDPAIQGKTRRLEISSHLFILLRLLFRTR